MARNKGIQTIYTNRKAFHEFFITTTFDAGLELLGAEIKSIRQKECSLEGSFVRAEKGQAYIYNMNINPYIYNTHTQLEPSRPRRLLLNKREINKLISYGSVKGQAIVPLEIFIKDGWAKVKIALAKGKKLYDKREALKKKEIARNLDRSMKVKFKL